MFKLTCTERRQTAVLAALVLLAWTSPTAAEPPGGRGKGWGAGGGYARLYDANTVETFPGEITKILRIDHGSSMSYGVHLLVKTEKDEVEVHLGPAWFVESQDEKLAVGDRVEVTGSRVTIAGEPAILAAEVKRGDEVLTLRDVANGMPLWAGWRRRH